jgi:hypothetical protein
LGKLLYFHSAGSYCTILDPTQIFTLVICSFTDIDEWGVYVYGSKHYEIILLGINKLWDRSRSSAMYTIYRTD